MIHSYKQGGLNIVLDVCSGAVHLVDGLTYDIIGVCDKSPEFSREGIIKEVLSLPGRENESAEEINECLDQIEELKKKKAAQAQP